MKRVVIYSSLLVFLLVLTSALTMQMSFKKKLSIDEYVSWYATHLSEFKKVVTEKELTYTVYLVPTQMELIKQYKAGQITSKELNVALKNKTQNLAFRIEISADSLGSKDFITGIASPTYSYENRVKYYAFDFKKDLKLKNGQQDTLRPANYIFERGNGLVPHSVCMIDYPTALNKDTVQLFIDNKTLKHSIQFSFVLDKKTRLPELKKINK